MEKKIEISFEELKNRSMSLFGEYSDLFKRSDNVIMLLAMYHVAFMIACHELSDQLKTIGSKDILSVQIGNGKFGGMIDFEIVRRNDIFIGTEALFDAGTFGDNGFTVRDIIMTLSLIGTYQPKLLAVNVIGQED